MTDPHFSCPDCGAPLPPDSPQALCPACLMRQALASRTIVDGDHPAPASPPLTPEKLGEKFPGYEIIECLGRGGMGVVYKACQKSLNRIVAIKILAPERGSESRFAERFAREAELLARLNHPHIVTIHDFGETGGLFYLVMEFVDGVNLRDLLRDGKLEPGQALAIVPPICDALQYAHDKGIVHRDIKPENLLLDRDGRIKIADFGIAKLIEPVAAACDCRTSPGNDQRQSQTAATVLAGTPDYAAPEQANGTTDHRADIYALGVVLYEMLTGERPGRDLVAPSKKVQIDVRLDEIVLRALEKTPELRYQTAGIFKTQVETIVSEMGSAAAPPSKKAEETSGDTSPQTDSRFSHSAKPGSKTTPAPETNPTRIGKWALGLFIGAVVGFPLLWGFTGAQEAMVLCVLALLVSLVLGLMSWRTRSGRFSALASGLGLLLLVAFTFNYLTPRPPRGQSEGGGKTVASMLVPNSSSAPKGTSPVIPRIRFKDTTLLEALAFFREHWPVNHTFEPAVTDAQKELRITVEWDGLTARQAMTAILDAAGLQIVENPETGVAKIVNRPKDAAYPILTQLGQGRPDTSPTIPKIQFEDCALLEALAFIREHWPVNYMFAPAVTGDQKEFRITAHWTDLTALQALTATLDTAGLQIVENPESGVCLIINKTSFGPVMERELRVNEETLVQGLDLESGKVLTLSREEFNRADDYTGARRYQSEVDWIKEMGLDMVVATGEKGFGIAGWGMDFRLGALLDAAWDTATESDLNRALEHAMMESDEVLNGLMIPTDPPLPLTYALRSGDKLGLLQITARLQNPDGIRLRYKRVAGVKATAEAVDAATSALDQKHHLTASAAPQSFGPATERVVHEMESGLGNEALRLESGELLSLPQSKTNKWLEESSANLLVGKTGNDFQLLIHKGILRDMNNAEWDHATPETFRRTMEKGPGMMKPGKSENRWAAYDWTRGEVPATFGFDLASRAQGMLQVLGDTPDGTGLRIRYKLLPGPNGETILPPDFERARDRATEIALRHYPDFKVNLDDDRFTMQRNLREFVVHNPSKSGDLSEETHKTTGPAADGFLLVLEPNEEAPVSQAFQADGPQLLDRPYWKGFVDHRFDPGKSSGTSMFFDFGPEVKAEFRDEMLQLLEK